MRKSHTVAPWLSSAVSIYCFLSFLAMSSIWCSQALAAGNGHLRVAGELLVQSKAGVSKKALDSLISGLGASTIGEIPQIRVTKIKVPEKALAKIQATLGRNPHIAGVEPNFIAQATSTLPDDPGYSSQWYLPQISSPQAWDLTTGAQSIPIAIIDSGVDPTHPDLAGKLLPGYNFVNGNTDTHDVLGHGTAVAGTVAAASDNAIGVTGVAWANPIMPLVVLDSSDYATYYNIAQAITYAADHGAKVINISIAGSSSSSTLQNAVNYAWNKGAVIFAAAANYSTDTPYYPAACANVVAVSATTQSNTLASFSNFGDWVELSAPGTYIYTTNNGGGYGAWNGTSFSSPIAAGVAALVWSENPSLTNTQVVQILEQNADDLGAPGYDPDFGYGMVDAYKSVLAAASYVPPVAPTPPSVSITSPADGSTVSGITSVDVTATDSTGVSEVELYVDGNLYATDTSGPFSFSWDTTTFANASHTLSAAAYDSSGNSAQTQITVNVANAADTTNPSVAITSPADGSVVSGKTEIDVAASDNVGVSEIALYIDGKQVTSVKNQNSLIYVWNTNARSIASGAHEIMAEAYDTSGNTATITITLYKSGSSTKTHGHSK